jgi:hypothetical protein
VNAASPTFAPLVRSPHRTRPLALRTGAILRLRDARGTVVHAAAGLVWITEEDARTDVVLGPGESHRIERRGRIVVAAQRASRLVLAWAPRGSAPRLERAAAEGAPGTVLTVPARPPVLAALRTAASTLAALAARLVRGDDRSDRARDLDVSPEAVRDRLVALYPLLRC